MIRHRQRHGCLRVRRQKGSQHTSFDIILAITCLPIAASASSSSTTSSTSSRGFCCGCCCNFIGSCLVAVQLCERFFFHGDESVLQSRKRHAHGDQAAAAADEAQQEKNRYQDDLGGDQACAEAAAVAGAVGLFIDHRLADIELGT